MFISASAAVRQKGDKLEHQQMQAYLWLSCSNLYTRLSDFLPYFLPQAQQGQGVEAVRNPVMISWYSDGGLCLYLWTQMMATLCLSSAWSLRLLEKENEELAQQPVKPVLGHLRKPRQGK